MSENAYILDELRSIRAEISSLKDTVNSNAQASIQVYSKLPRLEEDIEHLVKTVHLGNGSPPLTAQLISIRDSLVNVEEKLEEAYYKRDTLIANVQKLSDTLDKKVGKAELSESEIRKLKWLAYGKIAAAISLTIPGVVAFVSSVI